MVKILYFSASWCGPCKKFGPLMEKIRAEFKENTSLEIINLDVDQDGSTSAKYNVVSVPTLVYLKNGTEVHRMLGPQPKPAIISKINNLLRD